MNADDEKKALDLQKIKYFFAATSNFDRALVEVLHERFLSTGQRWERAALRSHKHLSLCFVDGIWAEQWWNRPQCTNATVAFGINYLSNWVDVLLGRTVVRLRDKFRISQGPLGEFTPRSIKFWSPMHMTKARRTIHQALKTSPGLWVVKPQWFSESSKGVLISNNAQELIQHVKRLRYTYPFWLLQEYVSSITPTNHFLKADVVYVVNKKQGTVSWYVNRALLFNSITLNPMLNQPPIRDDDIEHLSVNEYKRLTGYYNYDARLAFQELQVLPTDEDFEQIVLLPLFRIVQAAAATVRKQNACPSQSVVCAQYLTFDLILNQAQELKLIEINVVGRHREGCDFFAPQPELYKDHPHIQDPCSAATLQRKKEMVNDFLVMTIDQVDRPSPPVKLQTFVQVA